MMVQFARGDDDRVRIQPPSTLSFQSLSDIALDSIASYSSYSRGRGNDSRLRMAEVSRALLDLYGGSLSCIYISYKDNSAARLAALLRRQKTLIDITVKEQEAIPALCLAIIDGSCRRMERLVLSPVGEDTLTQEHLNLLAGVLERDRALGALPALRSLNIICSLKPGALFKLIRALGGGSAPFLKQLYWYWGEVLDDDLAAIADMLETRARIPWCGQIESFTIGGDDCWFDDASLDTRVRMLRALLPSVEEVFTFTWEYEFEACFVEVQATYLTSLNIRIKKEEEGEEGPVSSWKVFEAMPALARISISPQDRSTQVSGRGLRSISTALRQGALGNLHTLTLRNCTLEDADVRDFADALVRSGCSKRIFCLRFYSCALDAQGIDVLAELLCDDALPALRALTFHNNPDITDVGIVVLADGLLKALQTPLSSLELYDVGMGDEGVAALASLVSRRRTIELRDLDISNNASLTDQGILCLARAIDTYGLPELRKFEMGDLKEGRVTIPGLKAIVRAVITKCLNLRELRVRGLGSDNDIRHDAVMGILEAAGRAGKIRVR